MSFNSKVIETFRSQSLPVIQSLLESIDTPKSLAVSLKFNALLNLSDPELVLSEVLELSNDISFIPNHYLADEVDRVRRDLCAVSLLSKLPNIFGLDLKLAAIQSFESSEHACHNVNRDFMSGRRECAARDIGFSFDLLKRELRRILGHVPSMQSIVDSGGWGPGGSFALSRALASPEYKSECERTVTYDLAVKLSNYPGVLPPWFYQEAWTLVPGNLVTTVPKNIKTDRTIAIEPGVNSYVQKGIGSCIRNRLRKFGINLNDQRFNASMALEAEFHQFCTVDLKAASDSISVCLLERVLPSDWLDLIMVARSQRYSFDSRNCKDKTWHDYEKVSSMGNGFTFELESAIFFAILRASGIAEEHCYVYGDDLLFPATYYETVVKSLNVCGFTVNSEKSFHTGLFYESCGIYSFNNVDVTPIKMKDTINDPKNCIVFTNKIRMFAALCADGLGCDRRYLPAWRTCLGRLPKHIRDHCRGPIGGGITVFCNPEETKAASYRNRLKGVKSNYQNWTYGTLLPKVHDVQKDFQSLLQYRLHSMREYGEDDWFNESVRASGNVVKQRPTGRYFVSTSSTLEWPRFGGWIQSS